MTWASITGSSSGCTIQIKSADSLGNLVNNGSAVSVTPSNGTTGINFVPAASLQTASQIEAVYACSGYPSAGTLTLDFAPSITTYPTQGPQGAQASPWFTENGDGTHLTPAGDASARSIHTTIDNSSVAVTISGDQAVNLAQVGGASVALGQTTMSASIPVAIASNQSNLPENVAQVNGATVSTAAMGVQKEGIVGNAGAAVDQAPGSAVPANAIQVGATDGTDTRVEYMDPCKFNAWTYYVVTVSSNTQVVAGSSGKNVYICKEFIQPVAAAANVEVVESATSGNACATSPTGMMGGATAATGATIATNGGFVLPADGRAWAKTATAGDAVCIFVSAAATGVIAYVQF